MTPVASREGLCYLGHTNPADSCLHSTAESSKVSEQPSAANANISPVAGDHAVLARRYAGALYDLAEQEGAVDAVLSDLHGLRRLWQDSGEWRSVATDPRLKHDAVMAATRETVKAAGFGKLVANFLMVVAQNRRLSVLPAIIECFLGDVAARRGEYRADVRSAHALSTAQADKLSSALAKITGGKVSLAVTEDPTLLGGLTVQIGSKFFDASVKTRLDLLERQLKAGAVA